MAKDKSSRSLSLIGVGVGHVSLGHIAVSHVTVGHVAVVMPAIRAKAKREINCATSLNAVLAAFNSS